MPQINYSQLNKDISSGSIMPVYFLYGEEKYLLKKSLEKILKKVKPQNFEQMNYNEFNNESTVDEIANAVYSLPFMSEYKCVLVNDFNIDSKNASEISKLNELLEDENESTVLIFSYPTLNMDFKKSAKWRNFLKAIDKKYVAVKFEQMISSDLVKFINKICEQNGTSISKANANKIIEYVGTNMTTIKNETEKIANFVNGKEITSEDIENLATKSLETTVFILIKAIVSGDYQKAYSLLNLLFENGEEAVPILARISDTFVDLYRVRAALQSGKKATSPSEYGDYKGREFRLTNAARDIRNLSTNKLRQSLELLQNTDMLLKGSKMQSKIVLEQLIAKLLIINKGERIS